MKIASLLLTLVAVAAGLLWVRSGRACDATQTPPTLFDRQLFLGFRALNDPGSTSDYLIKIGDVGQFESGGSCASGCTLDLGNVAADLACQYGSAWYSRTDLLWAVVGVDYAGSVDHENTLFSTNPDAEAYFTDSNGNQGSTASSMETMETEWLLINTTVNSNGLGEFQDIFDIANSYASYQPGGTNTHNGTSFDYFDPPDEGIPSQILYFNRLIPHFPPQPGEVLGYFQLTSAGQLIFQPTSIPTPTPTPTPTATPSVTPTPTPSATPSVTPSATPTPTATPSASPTPTPTATPTTAIVANISTRAWVDTGDNVLIGGFIISGSLPKRVVVRAIGPSLPLTGGLLDPALDLYNSSGQIIASNDDWRNEPNMQDIIDSQLAPSNAAESAVLMVLSPGSYTGVVRGVNNTTGIALVEAFDLDFTQDSHLANVSTRSFVQPADKVMIGGLIVVGAGAQEMLVRAIGPSLPVAGSLPDPVLDLYNGQGGLIGSNDNWRDTQEAEIIATNVPPTNDAEAALIQMLAPGDYTAIVRGKGESSGVGLVEFYTLSQ